MKPSYIAIALIVLASSLHAQTTCPSNLFTNAEFKNGIKRTGDGSLPASKVTAWSAAFRSPQIYSEAGCGTPGFFHMWGNQVVGEGIRQLLWQPILKDHIYRFSACARWPNNNPVLPKYVRFKVRASQNALPSYTANWGEVVGVSGNITSTKWTGFALPAWQAAGDYNTVTINPENAYAKNDPALVSWGQLDSVCLRELVPAAAPILSGCVGDCAGVSFFDSAVISAVAPTGCTTGPCNLRLKISSGICPNESVHVVIKNGTTTIWDKTYNSEDPPAAVSGVEIDLITGATVAAGNALTVTVDVVPNPGNFTACKTRGSSAFEISVLE
jgi:hypothetical protein